MEKWCLNAKNRSPTKVSFNLHSESGTNARLVQRNQEGPLMTGATLARPCSAPAKSTANDKLAKYRRSAKAMSHEQRGTDAEVNDDAIRHYEKWQDLRKQATDKE